MTFFQFKKFISSERDPKVIENFCQIVAEKWPKLIETHKELNEFDAFCVSQKNCVDICARCRDNWFKQKTYEINTETKFEKVKVF